MISARQVTVLPNRTCCCYFARNLLVVGCISEYIVILQGICWYIGGYIESDRGVYGLIEKYV